MDFTFNLQPTARAADSYVFAIVSTSNHAVAAGGERSASRDAQERTALPFGFEDAPAAAE